MRFSTAVLTALVAIPAAVSAQNVMKVLVGDGGLTFNPSNVTAQKGDKIAFEFRSKNHTVTQSTFADPCIPASFNGSAGADSGYMFIDPAGDFSGGFPTWTITVNTDAPLWFHCAQNTPANHCQAGMVFSVNETPEKSFQAYLDKAKSFDPSTLPPPGSDQSSGGQPSGGQPSGGDPSSASSAPPSGSASGAGGPVLAPTSTPAPGAPPSSANPASASSAAQDQTGAIKNGAARTGVSVRGLSGVIGAIVLGAVLI